MHCTRVGACTDPPRRPHLPTYLLTIRILHSLKEKKMQSNCMLWVVDDDIEGPYESVPRGGRHDACCVTSYRLHLRATPPLRSHMTSYSSSKQGLRNLLIGYNSVNGPL